MIKKTALSIICLGFLWGCAGTQPQTAFVNNTFTSDLPKLKVRILKNVSNQKEKSEQLQGHSRTVYSFFLDSGEAVDIRIWRFAPKSNAEWRSSDERLIRNMGMVALGPISINDRTWVKFADLRHERNVALFGYFKRMDMNLVAVSCNIRMKEMYKDIIAGFKKTRVMTDEHKRIAAKAFLYIEQLVVIDPDEKFDKTGYGQTADTKPQKSTPGKKYIEIKVPDSVFSGGKLKYKIVPGDQLEVIRKKTCLDGKSECWEVKNVKTGETGFVNAEKMKQIHYVYTKE